MNREEAIARLRSSGLEASARDWAMGETIVIPVGDAETVPVGEPPQEIRIWPNAVYLYPDSEGWALLDLNENANPMARYGALEAGVAAVPEYVRARAAVLKQRHR